MTQLEKEDVLKKGRQCLAMEAAAINATSETLGEDFVSVVTAVAATVSSGSRLIFSGMGKNVHICQKLVGTFNSIGAPATFLDPNQALHGDLGLCREGDLAFFFSNHGETEDVLRLVPLVKRLGLRIVAVTSQPDSSLASLSDLLLPYKVEREACPLNLAPTASTTAAMAIGDAVAMVYLQVRGLTRDDFARFHPGGSLGRALLLRVKEIMRTGDRFARLHQSRNVRDALLALTNARGGTLAVVDDQGKLVGVFSDGDFRRCSIRDEYILQRRLDEVMTPSPKTVPLDALAVDGLRIFQKAKVNALIVVDDAGVPHGILEGQDLPRFQIV